MDSFLSALARMVKPIPCGCDKSANKLLKGAGFRYANHGTQRQKSFVEATITRVWPKKLARGQKLARGEKKKSPYHSRLCKRV